jgi:ATP-dependent Clp protease ATP-binding subunit ClpA
MNLKQYTQKTLELLHAAQTLAKQYMHTEIAPEHILFQAISQE